MPDSDATFSLVSKADLVPDRALRPSDEDAFDHDAIAANLAEHVACADTPLNIALYGPWGSGKSSAHELLRRRLAPKRVRLVHYDASRYGGESLRRNFISHAATELGFDNSKDHRRFHDGLYQGRKSASVDMPTTKEGLRQLLSPMVPLVVVFVVLLLAVAALGWGLSYATDKDVPSQISALLTGLAIPAGLLALLVAIAKAALDGATITTEQSQPSADEEFRRRFDDLVAKAREKHGVARLVFFVDELDRCTPPDVVKTLISIKTFLDHKHCVFVVAADREVLEQALTEHLMQATPYNEDNPYYSSASSFLDKVFHHQMFLPPLRKMKLTHFARDLVREREGLWEDLRGFGGQRFLDHVIYALVPSHVVSPRRVKVLLNNFATNVRVIQTRGMDWKERAPEIAKLTVLQTEFPSLAADLPQEPRLPELLLDPPAAPSPRLRKLLARHLVEFDDDGEAVVKGEEELPETDPLLPTGDGEDQFKRQRIIGVQNRDLHRYLRRTNGVGIGGPGRDLLYLESVGSVHGLEDLALSEIVERDSLEEPDSVIDAVSGRSDEERLAVVAVLCDMTEGEFGHERANVVSALMGIVKSLGPAVESAAARVVDALRSFQTEQEFADDHLVGVLQIGLVLATDEGRALVDEIFDDTRLFADPDMTRQVAFLLDEIPEELWGVVVDHVAAHLATDDTTLTQPVAALSAYAASALLGYPGVQDAVLARYKVLAASDSTEADAFIEGLYQAAETHGDDAEDLLGALQWQLLINNISYSVVRRHAPGAMELQEEGEQRDSHALRGLAAGTSEDWSFWAAYLSSAPSKLDWRPAVTSQVAATILAAADHSDAIATARTVASYIGDLPQPQVQTVDVALASALGARAWWADDTELAAQRRIYEVALALAEANTEIGNAVRTTLIADLRRVTHPTVQPGYPQNPSSLPTVGGLKGLRKLGVLLVSTGSLDLIDDVRGVITTVDASLDVEAVRTIFALASAASAQGVHVDLGEESVLINALPGSSAAVHPAADWLSLDPPVATVMTIARKVGFRVPSALDQPLSDWSERAGQDARTALVLRLLETAPSLTAWVSRVAYHGVDDVQILEEVASRITDSPRRAQRGQLVDFVVAVKPSGRVAHGKVAQIMLELLGRDTRVDFDLALRAAPALGIDHQHGEKLRQAFDDVAQRRKFLVPRKAVDALTAANVPLKQRSLMESAVDSWKAAWGAARRR